MSGEILVVDDDDNMRRLVCRTVASAGFEVVGVSDGREALDTFTPGRFVALITDLRMPGVDGVSLMQQVRQHDPEIPIILITGDPDLESARAAVQASASDYLLKPFPPSELINRLNRATQLVALRRENERQRRTLERRHAQLLARDRRRAELFHTCGARIAEPLAEIRQQTHLLLESLGHDELEAPRRDALELIIGATDSLWGVTGELLDLRLLEGHESGELEEAFEPAALLTEAVQIATRRTGRDAEVELVASEQRVCGDRVLLREILGKLLLGLLAAGSGKLRINAALLDSDRLEVTLEGSGATAPQAAWDLALQEGGVQAGDGPFPAPIAQDLLLARRLIDAIGCALSVEADPATDTRICLGLPVRAL